MATPSRLDDAPTPARPETPTRHESLVTRLVRLGALELELGWAETRNLVIRVAIAVVVAGGLAIGFLLSRMPLGRVVGISARAVQTGLAVASTLAAIDRFVAERRRLARAA